MRDYIDVTGKNEEEAISKALLQLNMDRDDVSVQVLERAKSGFLGLGAAPARIRVFYGPEEEEAPKPPAPREAERPAKPVEKQPPETPRPEKPSAKPSAPEQPPEAPKARSERPRSEPPQERPPRPAPPVPKETASAPPAGLGEPCDDERAQEIRRFLTGLLSHMESAAEVKVYQPEKGRYKVVLEGQSLGGLIGRRGETLDAIQQLTSYAVNRTGQRVRIQLDAENYREKREQSLCRLARKVAGKVVRYRRNVTLEPMNAYERHVIHTALQEFEGVTTYSTGVDPNRRVVVALDRGDARK